MVTKLYKYEFCNKFKRRVKKIFDKKPEIKASDETGKTWNWKQKQLAEIQQAGEDRIRESGSLPFSVLTVRKWVALYPKRHPFFW